MRTAVKGREAVFTAAMPTAPSFTVFDPSGSLVTTGAALLNGSVWEARFVVPTQAPSTQGGESYTLEWRCEGERLRDTFAVVEEQVDGAPRVLCFFTNDPVSDTLRSPVPVDQYRVQIMAGDKILADSGQVTSPVAERSGADYVYSFTGTAALTAGVPAFVVWRYVIGGATNMESHPAYLLTPALMALVNSVLMKVDKANIPDVNPNLRWTTGDIIHFLAAGVERINTTPPTLTSYTLGNFPATHNALLWAAGAREALQALHLAEGMNAFDFQGSSVSLNVDRTPFIAAEIDRLDSWLTEAIPRVKKLTARSSNTGSLHIALGPATNRMSTFRPYRRPTGVP
jgi:hypothetical protein